ncbi:Fur-regulated basic protein FbpA [Fictibacillus sp. WQ 8-8]|uniref:Fur-regulated basic protein FbpA n=1 Tax=Fictibacillus marinisediminis TaxID=2878389 RepID=A0A9X2BI31_9BACL|nr:MULTISPECIES: Fur-regulated basic protein FbpA [Fictibacillus]SFD55765.1 Fur-regulated basic protein A [Bacillus sp. OV194]MCK6258148.1 Fur-regulated basic protein FbpA [Fictibacillus marinisediminis]MCQ6266672.1 Fur-regulated basic protein FbpA [Fictibacillus sp. WQ 8-8]MED2971396.1 Fur-regulated basic protein FbpA [Fictibacillus sp. B-59209]UZJ80206.1 Fur-regulated basic protein FbpA [Fictibacillus sp. KU28468]
MMNVPQGQLRRAVEKRKQFLIQKLLHHGFILQEHRLLQEFTLSELEREWSSVQGKDNVSM